MCVVIPGPWLDLGYKCLCNLPLKEYLELHHSTAYFPRRIIFWQLLRSFFGKFDSTYCSFEDIAWGKTGFYLCVLFFYEFCVQLPRYCGGIFQIVLGYAGMVPVGERTVKPVIIIPPRGTSSHPAPHYNPLYHKAQSVQTANIFTKKHFHIHV